MRNGGQDKQMLWSLLDYHNVTATHRITQPNANHANSRNRKRTAFPMHTKLHKKNKQLSQHTPGPGKNGRNPVFQSPAMQSDQE